MSLTIEKRLPGSNLFTVAYVGTQGRHLPQNMDQNIIPVGRLLHGDFGLKHCLIRSSGRHLTGRCSDVQAVFGLQNVRFLSIHRYLVLSLAPGDVEPSAGKNLQYFATYTFAKALGTVAVNESDGAACADPVDTRGRSWGILPFDRTHVFNLSYNYTLPKFARGMLDNAVMRESSMDGNFRYYDLLVGRADPAALSVVILRPHGRRARVVRYRRLPQPAREHRGDCHLCLRREVHAFELASKVGDKWSSTSGLCRVPGPSDRAVRTSRRYYIRTPSRSNWDVSFFKDFRHQRIEEASNSGRGSSTSSTRHTRGPSTPGIAR